MVWEWPDCIFPLCQLPWYNFLMLALTPNIPTQALYL